MIYNMQSDSTYSIRRSKPGPTTDIRSKPGPTTDIFISSSSLKKLNKSRKALADFLSRPSTASISISPPGLNPNPNQRNPNPNPNLSSTASRFHAASPGLSSTRLSSTGLSSTRLSSPASPLDRPISSRTLM